MVGEPYTGNINDYSKFQQVSGAGLSEISGSRGMVEDTLAHAIKVDLHYTLLTIYWHIGVYIQDQKDQPTVRACKINGLDKVIVHVQFSKSFHLKTKKQTGIFIGLLFAQMSRSDQTEVRTQ